MEVAHRTFRCCELFEFHILFDVVYLNAFYSVMNNRMREKDRERTTTATAHHGQQNVAPCQLFA